VPILGDGVDDTQFAAFSGGCHVASVTCVDVCFGTFSLAVTASADRTARLWHLEERRCMATHHNNNYDISSVSIHPSGIIVAVSDENGIKLCDVCDQELAPADWSYDDKLIDTNGLRLRAVLPTKNSGAMRFSNGGSYLAAAHRNQVHVYDVWTRTLVVCLRDPVKTVTSLSWAPDDCRLNVGCAGGRVVTPGCQIGNMDRTGCHHLVF
jgi:WD40 repeat protein